MPDATERPGPRLPRPQQAALGADRPKPAYVFGRPWWAELAAGALFATGAYFAMRIIRHVDSSGPEQKALTTGE